MSNSFIPTEDRIAYLAFPIDSHVESETMKYMDWPQWRELFRTYGWTVYNPQNALEWNGFPDHSAYVRNVNNHVLLESKFLIAISPWESVGVSREIQIYSTMKALREILVCPGLDQLEAPKTPYLMDNQITIFDTPTLLRDHLSSRCSEGPTPPGSPSPTDPATQD